MTETLAEYRILVGSILATAVDSATWTTAIIDDAVRHALTLYNRFPIYESTFTVTAAGSDQDMSDITDLDEILAVAYPWSDGANFAERMRRTRDIADQTVYFEDCAPAVDDEIRVRYTKQHTIEDLDSASATTVPERHARIVALFAAGHACVERYRQLSENPATPTQALDAMRFAASQYMDEARDLVASHRRAVNPQWSGIGL